MKFHGVRRKGYAYSGGYSRSTKQYRKALSRVRLRTAKKGAFRTGVRRWAASIRRRKYKGR